MLASDPKQPIGPVVDAHHAYETWLGPESFDSQGRRITAFPT